MTLASSGLRDIAATRTRGMAIAGRQSNHFTVPDVLDRHRREPALAFENAASTRQAHEDWVASLETVIVNDGNAAGAGRRHPFWSAKLVSFHQDVWVGSPRAEVVHDVRRGCRIELRVQIGDERSARAVEDLVLRSGGSPHISEAFIRAFDRAELRASLAPAPNLGLTRAVFAPGVAGVVAHELIGHALEGDVVARGRTWISASTVVAAGSPVTVIDDPRRGRGAWLIDDEGSPTGETVLIDRGRPVGALVDRATASALGKPSTGNGRRSSYLEAVQPRMGCTFIASGKDDPDEIVRSTQSGVFIRRLGGGHADPATGRATFIVSDADRIIDGRLAGPLDAFIVELDGVESWSSIDRVAHDLAFDTCIGSCVRGGQPIAVSVGAPTIRIGVIKVRS